MGSLTPPDLAALRLNARAFLDRDAPEAFAPLLAQRQWLTYQLRQRQDGSKIKIDKVPVSASGNPVNVNNPYHWTSLNNAVHYVRNFPDLHHGIGYAFGPEQPFVGIDVDWYKLRDPKTGEIDVGTASYPHIVKVLNAPTLIQRSVSGKGFHLFGRLETVPTLLGDSRQGLLGCIEIYRATRFFAMTFDAVNASPIADLSETVREILDAHVQCGGELEPAEGVPLGPFTDRDVELVISDLKRLRSWYGENACMSALFQNEADQTNASIQAELKKALKLLLARSNQNHNQVDMSLARTVSLQTNNYAHFDLIMRRISLWPRAGKSAGYLKHTFKKAVATRFAQQEERREATERVKAASTFGGNIPATANETYAEQKRALAEAERLLNGGGFTLPKP